MKTSFFKYESQVRTPIGLGNIFPRYWSDIPVFIQDEITSLQNSGILLKLGAFCFVGRRHSY
jgi:hypothetical protein